MRRTQHAPRLETIIVALLLVLVGVLCTFGPLLTDEIGVYLLAAATILLLVGVFVEGI